MNYFVSPQKIVLSPPVKYQRYSAKTAKTPISDCLKQPLFENRSSVRAEILLLVHKKKSFFTSCERNLSKMVES
jgi:hypothetical protein